MAKLDEILCRTEKKYILTEELCKKFVLQINDRFEPAAYGESLPKY